MKILVTGTEGYIGYRLAPILASQGGDIVGLDTGYYMNGCLYSDSAERPVGPKTLLKDLRNITAEDLEGFDAVVHLAELSNDPLGANNPEVTYAINHQGSVTLAKLAKQVGVKRFVYASSCSVYGLGDGSFLDETSDVNPQTAYAKCKTLVEQDIIPLSDSSFSVTCLRNATAYGASPRMRFDIVINDLCALAWTTKNIAMTSDGSPWRPVVHIDDICKAISCVLNAPQSDVSGQIFNVGSDRDNYQIREIAEIVSDVFPGCTLTTGDSAGDNRSYRVSFEKITTKLPGFSCDWDARRGATQLLDLFSRIDMQPEDYQYRAFTRLKQLNYLSRSNQIDSAFYWTQR